MIGVYVALGANLDSPERQLDSACLALQQLARQDSFRVSSYYRSVPMGDVPQPDYVNAVTYFETELAPLELLDALQEIELQQGRQRLVRWGPRTLDLDLLLYGDEQIQTPRLTVPHYGIKSREFVLIPLEELNPSLVLPCGTGIATLITNAMRQSLQLIHPSG